MAYIVMAQYSYGLWQASVRATEREDASFVVKSFDAGGFALPYEPHIRGAIVTAFAKGTGHSVCSHHYIGHNYTGHNYIGHDYTGHKYIGYNYTGHDYGFCKGYRAQCV